MSEPRDESQEVRETLWGRALHVGVVGLAVLLPIWFALASFLIQIDPELNGFRAIAAGASDTPVHELPRVVVWSVGAIRAAVILAVVLPLVLAAWLLARALGAWHARRARRERERYDALVKDAAVLQDASWDDDRDVG